MKNPDAKNYADVMASNPPRLVITYTRGETREQDRYQWKMTSRIPVAQVIGFITRVQAELMFRSPDHGEPNLLVITYDPATNEMRWFTDEAIPVDQLIGTLELVKATLVDAQLMQMYQAKQQKTGLVDMSGKPFQMP